MKKILEIKNLCKRYHDENNETLAIDDISFDVYENEFISIVGTSGCGKSTLLSIIAGIENKSSGEIIFNKKDFRIGYKMRKGTGSLTWVRISTGVGWSGNTVIQIGSLN